MAANVFAAALRSSAAEGNDRNVLLALADCAWRDGVTWILVGDEKDDVDETICRLARVSKSTAIRSIGKLRDVLGEIQSVKVRRGRSFVTVYRVLHGAVDVDYERIPFELPHRFDEPPPIHGVNLTPSTEQAYETEQATRREGAPNVQGVNLTPSTGAAHGVTGDDSRCQPGPVQGVKSAAFKVSPPRARERNLRTVREPAAGTVSEPTASTGEDPAAVTDAEVSELVLGLRGADKDSPKRILPLAYGLPRGVFVDAIATVNARRAENPCGLLTHLLRIARAERTAVLSAQLLASMGPAPMRIPIPWSTATLKAEEPERYVRLLATSLDDGAIREALAAHADRMEGLLELAARVRAGDEPAAERDTPEQARARWVDRHTPGDPPADVASVIDGWDDVDPLERQALHERAEQIRDADDSTRKVA